METNGITNSLRDREARKLRNSWRRARSTAERIWKVWIYRAVGVINHEAVNSSPTLPKAEERRKWVQPLLLPEVGNGF